MSKGISTLLMSIAVVLLVVFNISLWGWTTLVNEDAFVDRTSEVLTDEASRDALASRIVDQLLADRPLVLATIGDTLKSAVAGVLGSELFEDVFAKVTDVIHRIMVSGGVGDVTIDISRVRAIVVAVVGVISPDDDLVARLKSQPDELVLFEGRDLPAMEQTADAMPWVCVISGLLAIGLIGWVVATTRDRRTALRRFGLTLMVAMVLTFILLFPLRSTTLSSFPLEDQRTIAATLFDSFAKRLVVQCVLLLMIGGGIFGWASSWDKPDSSSAPAADPVLNVTPATGTT